MPGEKTVGDVMQAHVHPSKSALAAYLALAAAVAGIVWSAIFVRWADVPGTVSAFYRVLIAAAVLIPWRLARGRLRFGEKGRSYGAPKEIWTAVAGGVFFALDLALWNTAVLKTQAAVASILGNNTPIVVALLSWLVLRRRPDRRFWLGLTLSLIGCVLILSVNLRGTAAGGSVSGDLMALAGGAFFAFYLFATERVRASMDTLTFNSLAIVGSLVSLLAICLLFDLPLGGFSPRTWWALAGLGFVTQLGAYYALVYALGHLPATITSVGLLAQVPGTAILAWLLLGEPLTAVQIAGGAVVLAGIYVVNSKVRNAGPEGPAYVRPGT
jgi:drug/metabolite transporter (DMT)-like permease